MHPLFAIALLLAIPAPAAAAEFDPAACVKLRTKLRVIDARARQRSTPALTDSRRDVKKRLHALRCSEIPKSGER